MNTWEQFLTEPITLIMVGILLVIFILVYILVIRRSKRITPEQRVATARTEKFRFIIFIPLAILFMYAWAITSTHYSDISRSGTPGDGKCDICGKYASYELIQYTLLGGEKTEEIIANEYCTGHGFAWILLHPLATLSSIFNFGEDNEVTSSLGVNFNSVAAFVAALIWWVLYFALVIDSSRRPHQRIAKLIFAIIMLLPFLIIYLQG